LAITGKGLPEGWTMELDKMAFEAEPFFAMDVGVQWVAEKVEVQYNFFSLGMSLVKECTVMYSPTAMNRRERDCRS
jgi:hypothetical protein